MDGTLQRYRQDISGCDITGILMGHTGWDIQMGPDGMRTGCHRDGTWRRYRWGITGWDMIGIQMGHDWIHVGHRVGHYDGNGWNESRMSQGRDMAEIQMGHGNTDGA